MNWQWWCTVLSLLKLVSTIECPEGPGCGKCRKYFDEVYEISCVTTIGGVIEVQIRPNDYVRLSCRNSVNWRKFNLGLKHPLGGISALSFDSCELPEKRILGTITKQLITDDIDRLYFRSIVERNPPIGRESFHGLGSLSELMLTAINLTDAPADLFHDLPNLRLLNLQYANLHHLPKNFFSSTRLEAIELSTNKLEFLDSDSFGKLERLRLLNIWNNRLVKISPHTFDELVALEVLNLRRNQLQILPNNVFHGLRNLKVLVLSENNFSLGSLPTDLLRNCSELWKFEMMRNRKNMTRLPSGFFANLTNLEIVKLGTIGLTSLPEDLFRGATRLRNVSIEKNYLVTIPSQIFIDNNNLSTLDVNMNDISSLPEDVFANLRKLVKLDLSSNRFTSIPEKLFSGLTSLRELNMEENYMISIHYEAFSSLQQLRVARFSYNSLTLESLDMKRESPFHYCEQLEELRLDHNQISDIFVDWMYSMSSLRVLDLSFNGLRSLMHEDLQFLSQDLYVDLTNNNISHVFLDGVQSWAAERTYSRNLVIAMKNNPIECDCDLYDMLRYLEGRLHPNVKNAFRLEIGKTRCSGPKELDGMAITDLQSKTLKCEANIPEYEGDCPDRCTCYVRPENKACLINCTYKDLREAPRRIDCPSDHRVELDLSCNSLTTLPNFHQPGYDRVSILVLDHNDISAVHVESLSPKLEVLKLDNNRLSRLEPAVIHFLRNASELRELRLESNPWICDCEGREFLSFVHEKSVMMPDLLRITCTGIETPVFQMTPEELCPGDNSWIVGGCLVAFFGIIAGIVAALYYRYQREMKVWLYAKNWCLWFVTEDELDRDKLFDAFISYSHKDEDFVVNDLMPNLEAEPRLFKLCVHFRDWLAGEWIPRQIARSVEESRRTIVVLSPNFLESVWGRMEFRAAHSQALSDGRARVIVILYGEISPTDDLDPELKSYLSMNTYVKWGDPWFWQKLNYAMPHPLEFAKRKLRRNIFEGMQPRIETTNDKSGLITAPGLASPLPTSTTPPPDSANTFITKELTNEKYEKSQL